MGRKWNNIKEKKGDQDKMKSAIYTKLLREVSRAVKSGGAEPGSNFLLKIAIEKCKKNNVPRDNVERAIKKGLGGEDEGYEDIAYEGYGPNGVAVFIEASTNNVTRTVANVRNCFRKCGGELGTTGCLQFIFDRKAVFEIKAEGMTIEADEFELAVIDAGAEDVVLEDGYYTVTAPMEAFGPIQHKLDELKIESEEAGLERVPTTFKQIDKETFLIISKLVDLLEADDDVTKVYHNVEYDESFAD